MIARTPAAGSVAQAVTETVQSLATLVSRVFESDPVAQITHPVTDAVSDVPVIGGLLDDIGVTGAIGDVVDAADDTVGGIGTVIDGTVIDGTLPPMLGGLDPDAAEPPGSPADGETTPAARPAASPRTSALSATPDSANWHSRPSSGAGAASGAVSPAPATIGADEDGRAPAGHPALAPPGAPASPTSSAGPGAGGAAAAARVCDDTASPCHPWMRITAASDVAVPTSPVADTDVSPD